MILSRKQYFYLSLTLSLTLSFWACNESHSDGLARPSKQDTDWQFLANVNPNRLSYSRLYDRVLTLWDVPFEEMDLETTLGTAHIITAGPKDGKPMVLLHGMNATSTMWYPNIKAFSENHRVYAIDFIIEPNRSKQTSTIISSFQLIDWYIEIFDLLKLNKFDLVGASRGGWLATKIALRDQDRINKLVLLGPAQTFKWMPASHDVLTNIIYAASPNKENLRRILKTLSSDVDNIEQLFIDQHYRAMEEAKINHLIGEMTPPPNLNLRTINIPVLVLIGDDDLMNPINTLKEVNRVFENGSTGLIKNAGHFLTIDQSEEINKRVLDFLDN